MIQIYKSLSENDGTLKKIASLEPGCWVNIIAPSQEELLLISKNRSSFRIFKSTFR